VPYGFRPVDRYFETCLPDRLQVVGEPLGELLDGVHVEGQAEILGQPLAFIGIWSSAVVAE